MTTTLVVHSVATMSRLIEFYKTQIRILWEWRGGRVALLKRLVITFIVAVISLIITAGILPGIMIGRLVDAAIAVILMTLFNSLIRPVILALVAPISLVLTGILVLVLQVLTFLVIVPLAPGVEVNGFLTALVGSFIYAAVNTVLTSIFAIDSGGSYFGLLVSTMMASARPRRPTNPALSSSRSMASRTRSSPGACGPAPSTSSAAGSATGATSSRGGRRSCRR